MAKRGPKPTPTPKLKLRNSWRGAARAGEIEIESKAPIKPRWLTGRAAKIWTSLVPRLKKLYLLAEIDQGLLAAYCQCLAEYEDVTELINRLKGYDRYVSTGSRGTEIIQPLLRVQKMKLDSMRQLAACFGLSPADRVGLKAEKPAANEDKKKKFFGRAD